MKYHTLFFAKIGKMSQNMSSAAVVIGTLGLTLCLLGNFPWFCCRLLTFLINVFKENDLVPDQDRYRSSAVVGPGLGPICLKRFSADDKGFFQRTRCFGATLYLN